MKKLFFVLCFLLMFISIIPAQQQPQVLDADEKKAVVEAVAAVLPKQYVFPETAGKMGELIRKNLRAGKYALLDEPRAFRRSN